MSSEKACLIVAIVIALIIIVPIGALAYGIFQWGYDQSDGSIFVGCFMVWLLLGGLASLFGSGGISGILLLFKRK